MMLELTDRLVRELNQAGIPYCHWKSNYALEKGLAGELDLDLLVDRAAMRATLGILARLSFKCALPRSGTTPAGIQHFYGLDAATGSLVHVHLFTRVLTGESFVKSHVLPLEALLLENSSQIEGIPVPSKSAELVLFILRTFIKYGSAIDTLYLARGSKEVRAELNWLMDGGDPESSLRLLERHCPAVEGVLFLQCVQALRQESSLLRRFRLARLVRSRLRPYEVRGPVASLAAYARLLWDYAARRLMQRRGSKVLASGGAVIAFVGPEATGKSTLVEDTRRWLKPVFPVAAVHAGKPPSTWLTAPINAFLPLARNLWPRLRTSRIEGHVAVEDDLAPLEKLSGFPGLVYAIRSVTLAWDRRRLLVQAARRAADGEIIISDRYPSGNVGAMDSPRLPADQSESRLLLRLAHLERSLYAQIPPPDVVLKLSVPVEVAKLRNRERIKAGKESDAYLESRHRQVQEWNRPGARRIYDIDTGGSLEATIQCVRETIWEAL